MITRDGWISLCAVGAIAAAGCSKQPGTAAGQVGATEDLRSKLPAAVAAKPPADTDAQEQTFQLDVHGATVRIIWRTFAQGGGKYIVSDKVVLVTPADGIIIERQPSMEPENGGTEAAPVETVMVKLHWASAAATGSELGDVIVKLSADGTAKKV